MIELFSPYEHDDDRKAVANRLCVFKYTENFHGDERARIDEIVAEEPPDLRYKPG